MKSKAPTLKQSAVEYLDRNGYQKKDHVKRVRTIGLMVGFAEEREVIIEKTFNALVEVFYQAYSKPLPLWMIVFSSEKSKREWYEKRSIALLKEFYNKKPSEKNS